MNFYIEKEGYLKKQISKVLGVDLFDKSKFSNVVFEIPNQVENGEFSTNVAMILARELKQSPQSIATKIVDILKSDKNFEKVWVAGPGFINFIFKGFVWDDLLNKINKNPNMYGNADVKQLGKVNLEFVSANPTGPMHIGHTRGAILGNALAKILTKAGYDVTKEYYVNDYGAQISTVLKTFIFRYNELLGLTKGEKLPEGCYPGEYMIEAAKHFQHKYDHSTKEPTENDFREYVINAMLEFIKQDLKSLDIEFDVFTSERKLVESGKVEMGIKKLDELGLVYTGKLPRPLGLDDEDEWEPTDQLLFKSSQLGDQVDRVLKRNDGSLTYFASDIAYHYDKFKRGFDVLINIWGADHGGYIPRLKIAVDKITEKKASLDILIAQMVNLLKDGKPFKMSKRAGNFVMVADILAEIDKDELKLYMLSRSADSQMSFDSSRIKEESADNIVYYIQYASARANSVINKFEQTFKQKTARADLSDFYQNASSSERALVRKIAWFPQLIIRSANAKAPHLVVEYLIELSREFHSLWGSVSFIDAKDMQSSAQRIVLIEALKNTIKNALECLGIEAKTFLTKE